MKTNPLGIALIVLNIGACIFDLCRADFHGVFYWLGAAILTAAVTF